MNYTMNKEDFVNKSNKLHKNKYDYNLVKYNNNKTKVIIICPKHGDFIQSPNSHLSGKGCPKCYGFKKSTKDIINEFKLIHNDKFDYSLVDYKNSDYKVEIICKFHGSFQQTPHSHLKGRGCPICNISKGEEIIKKYLEIKEIDYKSQYGFVGCKNKRKLLFDFYLPLYNICIEFQGKQHYEPIDYFGGKDFFKNQIIRDEIKKNFCQNNNIKLLIIKYNEDPISRIEKILSS